MKNISAIPALRKAMILFVMFSMLFFSPVLKAANYYWVGGSGNWNDFASHWATTSGGSIFHASAPDFQDDVYFDSNSFPSPLAVVTLQGSLGQWACNNFNCTGLVNAPTFSFAFALYVYGDVLLVPNMNSVPSILMNNSFPINMDPAGNTFSNVEFYGSGIVNLLGDINCSGLHFYRGGLTTNNFNVNISGDFTTTGQLDLLLFDFGTSVINCQNFYCYTGLANNIHISGNASVNASVNFYVSDGNFNTVNTPSFSAVHWYGQVGNYGSINSRNVACFKCNIDSVTTAFFNSNTGFGATVNKLKITYDNTVLNSPNIYGVNTIGTATIIGAQCVTDGNLTCDSISFYNSPGIILNEGDTFTVNNSFYKDGTPGLFNIRSSNVSLPAFFSSPLNLCLDSLKIENIHAVGIVPFHAGTNSVDLGGNTGWQFTNCVGGLGYYWVGGTGNWTDISHWATASGGSTFHTVLPGTMDDVYFDVNSFTSSGQIVTFDASLAFCKDFIWINTIPGTQVLASVPGDTLIINGSVFIDSSADFDFDGKIGLSASFNSCTISIADTLFADLEFGNNIGVWNLTNSIISRNEIKLITGFLYTDGYPIICKSLKVETIAPGLIDLGTSTVYFREFDNQNQGGYYGWSADSFAYILADSATFVYQTLPVADAGYTAGQYEFKSYSSHNYNKIIFNGNTSGASFPTNQLLAVIGMSSMNIGSVEVNNANVDINNLAKVNIDTLVATALTPKNITFLNNDTISINKLSSNQNVFLSAGAAASSNINIKEITTRNLIASGANGFIHPPAFGHILVSDSCALSNVVVEKMVLQGNGAFNSFCTFDTLMLAAAHNYTVGAGDSIAVNNSFIAFGNAGNLIQLNSDVSGAQADIHFAQGNVCSDYLSLRDMNAVGMNVSAGANSINISNNTGWQFTSCSIVSNVWPGDANYDLKVTNFDILNLGLAYSETGPVRAGASLAYVAQPATDWNGYFQTAVNKKHADTNGDGIVDDNDTTAISLNYGLTHPARMGAVQVNTLPTDPYLYLNVTPDSVNLSDTVYIETFYGTSQAPVDSVYGIAFTINYDTTLVDTSWISTEFLNSWFGQPGSDLLTFSKSIPLEQKIDIAMVRTDHNNVSGFGGPICRTGIVIVDNVAGRMPLPFTISDPYALTASEYELGVNLGNDTVLVDTAALGIGHIKTKHLIIAPNPAKDLFVIKNIPAQSFITIYNVQGEIVFNKQATGASIVIDTRLYSKGIYTIRVNDNNKMAVGKLIKL